MAAVLSPMAALLRKNQHGHHASHTPSSHHPLKQESHGSYPEKAAQRAKASSNARVTALGLATL